MGFEWVLKSIFVHEIQKNIFSCSPQPISEFSKQWALDQVGREASRDPFQPVPRYNFITKNHPLENQKWLLQKAQIWFNDTALYYCKAEKWSFRNLRVRKYNT